MDKKIFRRRNYFIDKQFQTRFIARFSILVLVGGLLTIALIYFLGSESKTVAILNSRVVAMTTADFILPLLLQAVLAVTIVVGITSVALTLLASHKIAGPLYRFKKSMEAMEQGDFSSELHIRSADQFHGLADEINNMIRKTKQELLKLKDSVVSLKQKLDGLSENDLSENKRSSLTELKKITEELDKALRYFKT
ncbi:MAG: methyl-accepting chemotaxis protein [Candidatus Omnitrophota bacterium]